MNNPVTRKVRKSWTVVTRKGKEWGKRNTPIKKPYTQWVREKDQRIKLPHSFNSSIFPLVPEQEPILPEDVEKLIAQIKELEVENSQLQLQLNKEKKKNEDLEDENKEVKAKFERSKKRARDQKGNKEWVGGALLGAN